MKADPILWVFLPFHEHKQIDTESYDVFDITSLCSVKTV